jgi:hypothetical protein
VSNGDGSRARSSQRLDTGVVNRRSLVLPIFAAALAPPYIIGLFLVVKSGVLSSHRGPESGSAQSAAVLTFSATVFATAVTGLGLIFTQSYNERENSRQRLETAVKGLTLLANGDEYAPKACVSGGLSVLLYLEHPVIAIRALSAAWADHKIDLDTTVWLISEVFRIGTSASQLEASKLLRDNAEQLTFSENMNTYIWPASIAEAWSTSLPVDARINNLLAL